jgi:hypothetical protein
MRHILLLTLLTLGACAANVDTDEDDDVELTTEAVCGQSGNVYTFVDSNFGASITAEASYKARALRTYMMYGYCGVPNDQFSCAADNCTSKNGVQPAAARLTGCFDLPSCAAWDCRECKYQVKSSAGGAWQDTGLVLHYQQGYGIAKYLFRPQGGTSVTTRIVSPVGAWQGD